jgi:hypothetical protein
VSDSETASQSVPPASASAKNFSRVVMCMLDIPPPPREAKKEKEVVTYSKDVQTVAWSPPVLEDINNVDEDEVFRKKVDDQVRKELDVLRLDEEKLAREAQLLQLEADKQIPG